MPDQVSKPSVESLCTFRVDDQLFGVEVCDVQEVIKSHQMTNVPLAPNTVNGLMNLRGQIVTALNLRQVMGLPIPDSPRDPMNVVIRTAEGPVSLMVDEICDVLEIGRENYEPLPETLQGEQRALMRGAYKLDDQLLLVLDTERVIREAA